ncbi:glycosyltransferase family 2 protein [Acinetobacter terrae]|uniref:Glycosyltransferase family 2 protein n=1 Tax=Acinetobacter terrae TaxID=2731247 RepID=A0A8E4FEI2_9GAMM|nr:glycosyltransferase family 2 protein [Acinetobacter terrae]NNH38957.1 glycosyltransferase family 2 protein [Acinetobacter terrae]
MNSSITIIIPLYNNEKHVSTCVETLKNQTDQNFEVVFIDDGSPDQTFENLEHCLKSDIKFSYKIIRQENKGAAKARKKGIENTSSEYIMIYDCDDVISEDYISEFYRIIGSNKEVDIIIPNAKMQNEKMEFVDFKFYSDDVYLSGEDCLLNSLNGWNVHTWFICKKDIFIKSYIDYEIFNIGNINYHNNDEVIGRINFINANKIIRNNAIYYYSYNPISATKSVNSLKYLMIRNAFIMDELFSNKLELQLRVKSELISTIWWILIYMNRNKSYIKNLPEWKREIRDSISKINYMKMIRILELKEKIKLTILKLIPIF